MTGKKCASTSRLCTRSCTYECRAVLTFLSAVCTAVRNSSSGKGACTNRSSHSSGGRSSLSATFAAVCDSTLGPLHPGCSPAPKELPFVHTCSAPEPPSALPHPAVSASALPLASLLASSLAASDAESDSALVRSRSPECGDWYEAISVGGEERACAMSECAAAAAGVPLTFLAPTLRSESCRGSSDGDESTAAATAAADVRRDRNTGASFPRSSGLPGSDGWQTSPAVRPGSGEQSRSRRWPTRTAVRFTLGP